jgi:predicted negative regulator of RcsB-dependent stress response
MSAGMTLKELAKTTEVPVSLIYQYVRGITNVPPQVLSSIATITHMNVEFFDPDRDIHGSYIESPDKNSDSSGQSRSNHPASAMMDRLAEAYSQPMRNIHGYKSVLLEKLAASRTRNNRAAEAELLFTLGKFLVDVGEFGEAKNYLNEASDIFDELGRDDMLLRSKTVLARCLLETGAMNAAIELCDSVIKSASGNTRIHSLILMASINHRNRKNGVALRNLVDAAAEADKIPDIEKDAKNAILFELASIMNETGHYPEALQILEGLEEEFLLNTNASAYLDTLLESVNCLVMLGSYEKAKEKINLAIGISRFHQEEKHKNSIARAILANILMSVGKGSAAKAEARSALLTITDSTGPAGALFCSIALGRAHLAENQLDDALAYTDQAIREAQRWNRINLLVLAKDMRIQILRKLNDKASPNLLNEARQSLEFAVKNGAPNEIVLASLTLAGCLIDSGNKDEAEKEIMAVLETFSNGAIGIEDIPQDEENPLPMLSETSLINLEKLLVDKRLELPGLKWKTYALLTTFSRDKKRAGDSTKFNILNAALEIIKVIRDMKEDDVASWIQLNPDAVSIFDSLKELAVSHPKDTEMTELLIKGYRYGILKMDKAPL